ncbi:MAG: S41 family peptidase [Thermoanaerobaculia bacterium]
MSDPVAGRLVLRHRLFALAFLAVATVAGGLIGPSLVAVPDVTSAGMKEYADLLATTRAWYADEIAPSKLVYASIQGMLSGLDPHTNFLEPEEYGAMQEKQRGSFYGLGIIISKRNGKVTVITTLEGSPADRLGIRAGDIIDRVEGQSIDDLAVDAVVRKLKGPKGTKVRITVVRPGLPEPLQMTVTRAEIPTNSVSYAFMIQPGVGYIRLKDFTQTSSQELGEAWDRLEKLGMKKLLFDLRGNPGGLLDQAIGVSDFFLSKGDKIVSTRGRTAGSDQSFVAPGKHTKAKIPVVVLLNKGSASASEIVAGAVQDHDRGLIVGQTSWGKGLVQSVFTLSDGAGLALTTAKYYTPSGRCIQRDYKDVLEYLAPETADEGGDEGAESTTGRETFRTDANRTVYGGGGITPDILIKPETLSRFSATLYARGLFFEFAVQYRASHPDVPRDFQVSDAVRDEFLRFLEAKPDLGWDGKAREMYSAEKDPKVLDRAICEELLTAVYGREAGYRSSLDADVVVRKGLSLFPEAEKLASARAAALVARASTPPR